MLESVAIMRWGLLSGEYLEEINECLGNYFIYHERPVFYPALVSVIPLELETLVVCSTDTVWKEEMLKLATASVLGEEL